MLPFLFWGEIVFNEISGVDTSSLVVAELLFIIIKEILHPFAGFDRGEHVRRFLERIV